MIDSRFIVKSLCKAQTHQLYKVLIAGLIFAQQYQVIVFARCRSLIQMIRARIDFTADNRVNAALLRLAVKIHNAVHYAVIGYGAAVHAQFLYPVKQLGYARRAIQQTVLSMYVQVSKQCPAS